MVAKACVYSQFSGSWASLEGGNTLNLPFPPTLTLTLTAKLLVTLLLTINIIAKMDKTLVSIARIILEGFPCHVHGQSVAIGLP